jgi:glycopeptide antibiotics resistance protein
VTIRLDWLVAARLGYVAVILLATLTELHFDPHSVLFEHRLQRALSPRVGARDVVDGLRNVLLFAGWGLVWSMTAPSHRLWRSVAVATATGMLLSAGVETLQLFSPRRHSSILDVISNTGGAAAGALVSVMVLRATSAARDARSFVGVPLFLFAAPYAAAALLEIALPGLHQELLPGTEGDPLRRLRHAFDLMVFELPSARVVLVQLAILVPAGALLLATFLERGWSHRRSLLVTAGVGVPFILLAQIARGVTGQPVEPGKFIIHAAGFLAGAALAYRFLYALTIRLQGRQRSFALIAAWICILILWRWRPFWPATSLDEVLASFTAVHLLPLQALAARMDLFSASRVAVGFLLHTPLGVLLAVRPLRRRGVLAHLWPGLWIVAAVEVGQIFIAGLVFDVTDVIIGSAGVAAGWLIVRRAGFGPCGEEVAGPGPAVDRQAVRR